MLLVVAVLAVSYASSVRAWLQQRSDINTYSAQIAASKANITSLQHLKQRLHDPAYLHAQARERFGWVLPGQVGYRVIGASGHVWKTGTNGLSLAAPASTSTSHEWWDRAWRSIVAAGATGPSPSERAYRHRFKVHGVSHIGRVPAYRPPPGVTPRVLLPDGAQGVPQR
jgi:Septum formation initiator